MHNKAFIDIRLCPGIATSLIDVAECSLHLSASRPLRLNVTSSIKPKVHNIAQRRRRRTEPQPQGIFTQNFMQIGPTVPEICSRTNRHTDAQTNGLITIRCTLLGRSKNFGRQCWSPLRRCEAPQHSCSSSTQHRPKDDSTSRPQFSFLPDQLYLQQ